MPIPPEIHAPPARASTIEPRSRLTRVIDYARREPLYAALALVGAVCVLLPIWIGRYVPLLDYPNHLSMVFVWFHLNDPQWNFAPYYTINLPPLPYWAHYGFVYALSFLFGPEIAQKIFLSLALLLFPVALAVYARRMGRDPRLGLLAFPFAWSYGTANGFLSYIAGIPAMLFALSALDRYAEKPSLRWGVIAALAGAGLYFFHVLPWALFLLAGGACALMAARPFSLRAMVLAPLPALPAALIGAIAYRASRTTKTPFNPWNREGLFGFSGAHNSLFDNLSGIPGWLINFHPGQADEVVLLIIAIVWLLLLALRDDDPAARAEQRTLRGWRLEMALAIVTASFLVLPRSLMKPFYWYAVNGRLAVVMALLALLLVRGRIDGARRWLLALGTAAGLCYCVDLAAHFHRFNLRAHGFDELMEKVPPGKQVLPIMLALSDPDISVNAYNQWGSYVQERQGGYMQFNFVSEFPVRYKRKLASPPWDHPELFNFRTEGADWDYFIVRRGNTSIGHSDPFAGYHDRVQQVARSGDWELWQKLPPH